jgi:hypothetical protein
MQAWNLCPRRKRPLSAEFVESFVIFLYGVTNTWLERFGAAPGSPFTAKQVQHISIAVCNSRNDYGYRQSQASFTSFQVMFWFGGMIGMAIESRRFRRWLGSAVTISTGEIVERKTNTGSFNPMQIHQLWGNFLVGFAVLRSLTYFFLWLRPPHSVLPSRPPTELVASFFLTCGGISFIFSTEQITFAAMRRDHAGKLSVHNFASGYFY